MSARTYRQHCGIAAALDLLGERWTLLVVRELMLGPKRFRDLLDRLTGIGTNLLTARLRSLEDAGVIARATLPPPAGVPVYALTERGRALEPTLDAMAVWGYAELGAPGTSGAIRPAWAGLSMGAVLNTGNTDAPDGVYVFAVDDGEAFHARVRDGYAEVGDGLPPADTPVDVTVRGDLPTLYALATRATTAKRAGRSRAVRIDGDPARLDALLAGFHLPTG